MGPRRGASKLPPPGDTEFWGLKNADYQLQNENQKKSRLERYKTERESNWDPEGEQASSPLRGIKNRGVKNEQIPLVNSNPKKFSKGGYKKEERVK